MSVMNEADPSVRDLGEVREVAARHAEEMPPRPANTSSHKHARDTALTT